MLLSANGRLLDSQSRNRGSNPFGSTKNYLIMKINKKIIISIILGIIVIFSVGLFTGTKIVHYDFELNQLKEYELKYWNTKSQLVDEVQNYINTIAPTSDLRACVLIDACEKYNIEVKFVLA